MKVDDKVCEQVSMSMLEEVYPKAVIERCVQQSEPWSSKARRVRASTALALVLLAECGSHAVVGLELDHYEVSEVHGAHRLLEQVGPNTLVLMDAGITSGGFLQHVRKRKAHALGA